MAIDNQFGKGIGLAAGFDLGAQKPLDSRVAVNTIAERDAHVIENRAYEGMLVYVAEDGKTYQLVKEVVEEIESLIWEEFGFNQEKFDASFDAKIASRDERLETLEDLVVGGEGEGLNKVISDVANNKTAIERLDGEDTVEGSVKKQIKDAVAAEAGLRNEADIVLGERLEAIEEDLAQGGETEARIAQAEADIDALQGLVGKPVEGETPATGLHLALDTAKEELNQAILTEKGRAEGQEAAIRQKLADEAAEIRDEMAAELGNYTVEAAEGVEGKEASGLRKEIEDAHKAIDQAMASMKKDLQDEIDADVLVEKNRAEGQEAAIRQEMATETQRVDKKIADDIAKESALRVAEEQRIEGLVEAEAGRADAEEKRIVGLVEAEKGRAEGKEGELLAAINKEVQDRGKAVQDLSDKHDQEMEAAAGKVAEDLAALKTELQGKIDADVAAEALSRENADKALDERVKPLEEHVAAQPGIDAEQDNRIKALEDANKDGGTVANAIKAAQAAADQAQSEVDLVEGRALELEGKMEAVKENIARLDGAVDVEGSVKKQIKDAIDEVNGAAEELEGRVEALETFKNTTYPAAEAKVREDFAAADAQVLTDAKKYADDAITELVDSAPDAMNTLNELAKAINDNKGVYDAYIEQHATAMAKMKTELQADVEVVADDLADLVDLVGHDVIKGEIGETIADASGLVARIIANETFVAAQPAKDTEQDRKLTELQSVISAMDEESTGLEKRIGDLEDFHKGENSVEKQIEKSLQDAKDYADAQDIVLHTKISAEIDVDVKAEADLRVAADNKIREDFADADTALHTTISAEIDADVKEEADRAKGVEAGFETRIAANEAFVQGHSHEDMEGDIEDLQGRMETMEAFKNGHNHSVMEQGIADNKAAIEKEVKDRATAIEEALEAYSTTEEMKQVIGNVVSSLSLTMENDKVVLKLGGEDGISLTEVSLDMVTDDDIDAIIAGLDAPAAE